MHTRRDILIMGAGPTARALGGVLARSSDVCLVDSNREHCTFAEADGLAVVHGNALKEQVLREAGAHRAGTFIALTPNAEVNALAAQLAGNVFDVPVIHILCGSKAGDGSVSNGHAALLDHLQATTLFAGPVLLTDWDYWIAHNRAARTGLTMERLLAPPALFEELQTGRVSLPLAIRRGAQYLPYHSGSTLQRQDRIIVLRTSDALPNLLDRFDRLVARCPVLDVNKTMSLEEFFALTAAALSEEIGLTSAELMERFMDRETAGSTVIAPGLAIPHVLIESNGHFHLAIARCRNGISFPGQHETVHAVFVLIRSPEERNFHLRALAAIAQVMQDPDFEARWLQAGGPEDLRRLVLQAERRRYPERENDYLG